MAPHCVKIPYNFQKTWYSCGASCLQMMLSADGIRIGHRKAIELLNAYPDGTDISDFQRVYRQFTGRRLAPITIKGVKRAINRGVPVLAEDSVRSEQDHVVVIYGYRGDEFLVHDPAFFLCLRRGLSLRRRNMNDLLRQSGNRFYSPSAV